MPHEIQANYQGMCGGMDLILIELLDMVKILLGFSSHSSLSTAPKKKEL